MSAGALIAVAPAASARAYEASTSSTNRKNPLAEESRAADQRLGERIEALVIAIGGFLPK
jgi:hypothetical protein